MALLQHDVLIVDQVRGFLNDSFAIADVHGQPTGWIRSEGGTASRLLMGNRKFLVEDADGAPVVRLNDVVSFGRERMQITAPDGSDLATLIQKISFLKTRIKLELANGRELQMDGSFFERDFTITSPELGEVARVGRQYRDIGQSLLGRERYVLQFAPQLEPWQRATVIGAVIGIDIIRAKARNN